MIARPRLLLIAPRFHGYWRSIADAFSHIGYDVVSHLYDAHGVGRKAFNKLRHELPLRLTGVGTHLSVEAVTSRAVHTLAAVRPDRLLVVRGDALGESFWSAVKERRVPAVLWLYDELHRLHNDPSSLAEVVRLASYSRADVRRLRELQVEAAYVPLAFDPTSRVSEVGELPELSFVGARYPSRERVLRFLVASGLPVRAYGRDWSDHPFDRLRTWRLASSGIPARRDVPLGEGYAVMRASRATLNLHGDQDGFTIRTFEAAGAGAVQLIDREAVQEFYEPEREVLAFKTEVELVELSRRILHRPSEFSHLRESARRRTLAEHTFVHRANSLQRLWE